MASPLLNLLYKEDKEINKIVPLVPSLWTRDPMLKGLSGIENAYPPLIAIEHRLQLAIEWLKQSELEEREISNKTAALKRMLTEGGPRCALVRDYNGEYAPAIAALLSNGSCVVIPGRKPTSMIATLNQVISKKVYARNAFKDDDNAAVAQLDNEITITKAGPLYFKEEGSRCLALTEALFLPFNLNRYEVITVPSIGDITAMADLHQRWARNGTLSAFRAKVVEITPKKNQGPWFRGIALEGGIVRRPEAKKREVAINENNTFQLKVVTYSLWIRRQDPKAHSHNMGQDLLNEIVTAIAHVSRAVYPGANFNFILFGDREAAKMSDLPVHSGGSPVDAAKSIPQFIADKFGSIFPEAAVVVFDLRSLYSRQYFKTPSLDKLQEEDFGALKTAEDRERVDKQLKVLQQGSGQKNLTYSQQYASFLAVDKVHQPRFIIGAESGNMDGFGYCGTPVISVDVEDENDMVSTILGDRIGQYTLVTPLWEVVNYHRGAGKQLATFRRHLYGAILKYTAYAGSLHETKAGKPSTAVASKFDKKEDKEELAKKVQKEKGIFDLWEDAVDDQLAIEGFTSKDVTGDGNCLFRALSVLLFQSEEHHLLLRQEAVETAVVLFQDELAVVNEDEEFGSIEDYSGTMKKAATPKDNRRYWGGFPEIVALAIRYDISISVHSTRMNTITANDGANRTLHLHYLNRNHYRALTPV
jgi:hypothetical protein